MEHPVLAQLEVALGCLAAIDGAALAGEELSDLVVGLTRLSHRLDAHRLRLLGDHGARRVFRDDGHATAASWLAHRGRMTRRRARREARFARVLRSLPSVAAALRDGTIGADAAEAIVRAHHPATAAALERDEGMLVAQAARLEATDFERVVHYWEQRADPEGTEEAAAERRDHRRFACTPGVDGQWLQGWLPAVGGATFANELARLEQQLFEDDWKAARAAHGAEAGVQHLQRSATQRRADALVEMAVRSATLPAGGRRPAPLLTVLVGYETFAGAVCQLACGSVVTPGEVAALLDDAVIERVVFDGPDRVVDVGERRFFTGALRRAIEVRDRTCTNAGCHDPAELCEVDHIRPAAEGGPTTQENGTLRCPFHHRQRHRHDDARPPPGK